MITPIQISDSLALRAKAEAINSSVNGALDRIVASLLATTTHTIHRSRRGIFPTVVHPLFELPRKDRLARDDSEKA
jgi:hypothetical protein